MAAAQTYKNHMRFDPLFHFFLIPLLLLNIGYRVYRAIRHWPLEPVLHIWWIVLSIALLLIAQLARIYARKNQDRIIRLEERLRLATLLPAGELPYVKSLTTKQLIALRFASDAELPALALRAATENLDAQQIKQSITVWKPDTERV